MRILFFVTVILFAAELPAEAQGFQTSLNPGLQCRSAIRTAERAAGIPEHLMAAIGRIESGRLGPDGVVHPWPWSINAEGTDYVYETKAAVIAAVQALQAKGVRSIDVGCMQVNLMYHPQAFATLDQAFDPLMNARYAARFLVELKAQTGTWDKATAWYHSATPELGEPYQRKVAAVLPEEKRRGAENVRSDIVAAWGATLGPGRPAAGMGFMLSNHAESARMLPMPGGAGRGLDSYRARPIPVASRATGHTPL
jgi:hypothetical protein